MFICILDYHHLLLLEENFGEDGYGSELYELPVIAETKIEL